MRVMYALWSYESHKSLISLCERLPCTKIHRNGNYSLLTAALPTDPWKHYRRYPNLETWHEWHNECLKFTMLCSKVLFAINNSLNARPKQPFILSPISKAIRDKGTRRTCDGALNTFWAVSWKIYCSERSRRCPQSHLAKAPPTQQKYNIQYWLCFELRPICNNEYKLSFQIYFLNTGSSDFVLLIYHRNSFDLNNATIK